MGKIHTHHTQMDFEYYLQVVMLSHQMANIKKEGRGARGKGNELVDFPI